MRGSAAGAAESEGRGGGGAGAAADGAGVEGERGEVRGEGVDVYGAVCACVDGLSSVRGEVHSEL